MLKQMIMFPRSSPIARKFVVYIVLLSSLITLIATAIQLLYDYRRDVAQIEDNIARIRDSHLSSLVNSVWVEDDLQIRSQLDGLARYVDIEYLEISLNGKTLWSAGERRSTRTLEKEFPLQRLYAGEQVTIGVLRVVASIDSVISRLIDKALVILLSNAIKTFVVAAFIFFLFYYLVARHLTKLIDWANTQDLNKGVSPMILDRPLKAKNQEPDEVDLLTSAVNAMQKSIVDAYEKLKFSHRSKSSQLQLVVSSADLLIWSIDRHGVFELCEGKALVNVNLKAGELEGKSIYQQFKDNLALIQNFKRSLLGESTIAEIRLYERLFEAHFRPKQDETGEIIGSICVAVDITDRYEAEQEAHRAYAQIKRTNLELEATNKELEAYSYSIAHDLRSPLRTIIGFCQIVLEESVDKLDKVDVEHLQRVIKAAKHMAELIDDILEISRVSRSQIQAKEVDLSELCHEIEGSLSSSEMSRTVEWRIQPDVMAYGDPRLLYVVLNNLLGNAWKFTKHTTNARIEFGVKKENGEQVYFVKDNGAGFDMDHSDKLFGLFQRLHRSDEYEGTGIGLATVQRILKRHQGWVKVKSEKGKGATIFFAIPRVTSGLIEEKKKINALE